MIHRWDAGKLAELVGSFGDVEATLGLSQQEFQQGWHEFVAEHYWTL